MGERRRSWRGEDKLVGERRSWGRREEKLGGRRSCRRGEVGGRRGGGEAGEKEEKLGSGEAGGSGVGELGRRTPRRTEDTRRGAVRAKGGAGRASAADAASRLRRRGGRFPAGQGRVGPHSRPPRKPPGLGRAPPFKSSSEASRGAACGRRRGGESCLPRSPAPSELLLLLLSRFSHVPLCATP